MVHRVFSAFLWRVSNFKGRLIRQILAKIMKIYSDFLGVVLSLGRLIRVDMRYLLACANLHIPVHYFTSTIFKQNTVCCDTKTN